ncbi:MAG: hypothetical protein LBN71_05230 [Tannerella sp.]|nr:hypothetical protein [Tannerella sp.]
MEQIPEYIESINAVLFGGAATDTEVKPLREWKGMRLLIEKKTTGNCDAK